MVLPQQIFKAYILGKELELTPYLGKRRESPRTAALRMRVEARQTSLKPSSPGETSDIGHGPAKKDQADGSGSPAGDLRDWLFGGVGGPWFAAFAKAPGPGLRWTAPPKRTESVPARFS